MERTVISVLAASMFEKAVAAVPKEGAEWQELILKARLVRDQGELQKSVEIYKTALALAEKALGSESGEYWFLLMYMLTDLTDFLESKQMMKAAEPHYTDARKIIESLQDMLAEESGQ